MSRNHDTHETIPVAFEDFCCFSAGLFVRNPVLCSNATSPIPLLSFVKTLVRVLSCRSQCFMYPTSHRYLSHPMCVFVSSFLESQRTNSLRCSRQSTPCPPWPDGFCLYDPMAWANPGSKGKRSDSLERTQSLCGVSSVLIDD